VRSPSGPASAGVGYALAAYSIWGVAPVYWKAMGEVPAPELLGHRVLGSVAVGALLLTATGAWPAVRAVLRSPRILAPILLTAALIGVNWLTFLWAVNHGRVMATSLGYYVTPLVQVALGALFLGERLSRGQALAVALASAGVLQLALTQGGLPWIAGVLALSFGFYGLLRKVAPVAPLPGFAIEVMLLAPAAALYLGLLAVAGDNAVPAEAAHVNWLVASSGAFTAAPLLCFHGAAKRLRLVTVGFFQYLAPSLTLGLAVVLYGEPFGGAQAVAFGCVWAALLIFSWDALRALSAQRAVARSASRA
jgi:chloramphenicol-sensitive protein RarD